jgi:hypothetical protein
LTSVPTALNANKLLLSKWTAVEPREREKHFMVVKVLDPLSAGGQVTHQPADLAAAEQQQHHHEDNGPMPDAERTHVTPR